jgi:hypothetical protein
LDERVLCGGNPQVGWGDGGSVSYRNWLGRTAVITSGAVSGAVFVSVGHPAWSSSVLIPSSPWLVGFNCFLIFIFDMPEMKSINVFSMVAGDRNQCISPRRGQRVMKSAGNSIESRRASS